MSTATNRIVRLIGWLRAHYLPTFLTNATGPLQRKMTMTTEDPSDPEGFYKADPDQQDSEAPRGRGDR